MLPAVVTQQTADKSTLKEKKIEINTEQPWQWSHFGMWRDEKSRRGARDIERIKQKGFSAPSHTTKQTAVFLSSVSQPLSYLHQSTALALSYWFVPLCGLFFYHPSLTWTYVPLIITVRFHLGPLIKAEWRIGAWRTSLITAAERDTHHLHQPFPVNITIIIIIIHHSDQYSSTSAPVACVTLEWRHTIAYAETSRMNLSEATV